MGLHYLTYGDRKVISQLVRDGVSAAEIAKRLGVHVSTIYRELTRGETGRLDEDGHPAYSADKAQETVRQNAKRKGKKSNKTN